MLLSGAQIVIEELVAHGVDTVFGYPGGNVIDIYDELYKNRHRLTHILTAHEQGAAHAADAYARVSGKTSAALATSGPGATNLVTGVANAYLDSVPVVFLTGNVPISMMGRDSFQEIDILGVTLPIVKHSYVVKDVSSLQRTLKEAFLIAGAGRKGPVLVDIPKCVQLDTCEYDPALTVTHSGAGSCAIDSEAISALSAAIGAIEKSSRPFIYCGGGAASVGAGAEIMELATMINAPVGMSLMGIGAIPDSFEMNLGMCGMQGLYASAAAQSEADLIIALGARFSDRATCDTKEYAKNRTLIHIDIDAAEIGKNVKPDVSICADLKQILPMLLARAPARPGGEWAARIRALKNEGSVPTGDAFTPRNIIGRVNEFYSDDTIVATDVGQHQMWVAQYYRFEKPRKLVTSGGLGAMGFGLGASIGASIAAGRERVVLFTGDGSFGMNLTELATAVTQKLPITIIVLNNGVLGMVRQIQAQLYDNRYSETTLERRTDFPALAKAFGAAGYSASSLSELDEALKSAPCDGPCLIDCKIGIDN